ncbi:phosphomethylpyrimidine synthase ThiC [Sulfuracidifex metallicus]|jgi:phosphomethylpyrimidine synthase|uniref:Phosphomethylpyrimidine synthase n=1 Tax=Sulfuracidifex metallicus DSM 6482 = JCM 9184 TaxID=523847 RepID=A0A6A9QM84_SULME|nr:phosphomethylpyrimidine synthase ThiC [Sulfuracidifex metallicus]MUN28375.1 phosphomethylpyrimidine synthase ThiC [Sulfuracidifex metallicus DSM 6482 = JCM 9184]WOE51106.1 phosphomethylpyrimidine synthase ThiC [Sulfuracidifex metallicus DSM 6482 = JCM 9184]
MPTQIELARRGQVTEEMKIIAEKEGIDPVFLREKVASGRVVIFRNLVRNNITRLTGIGEGLTTKVNVNIGASTDHYNVEEEMKKVEIANEFGADTIMDLTDGGDIDYMRKQVISKAIMPVGTVPIYQVYYEMVAKRKYVIDFTEDDIFRVIEKQFKDGVDYVTVHTGVTLELARRIPKANRLAGVVSRGGTVMAAWSIYNEKENPLYSNFDYLMELAKEYDVTLSLGDALRPGGTADAHDELHVGELMVNSSLAKRAVEHGVQVMIEGPGHMPLDQIEMDVKLEKQLSGGVPYYVLGILVTDIAAGYDHIAGAIGGAIAAQAGADMLCYLTPAEHLSLPTPEQVKEGLIAFKIAAHAGDMIKLGDRARQIDNKMSKARSSLDWKTMFSLTYDPNKAKSIYRQYKGMEAGSCTMCGDLCVYLVLPRAVNKKINNATQGKKI